MYIGEHDNFKWCCRSRQEIIQAASLGRNKSSQNQDQAHDCF